MRNYSETKLVILLRKNEVKAFDELYKRNWKLLYRVACRSLGCEDEAMDLVQNVFVSFWNSRHRLQTDKSVSAYLFTTLKNNLINFYRRENLKRSNMEVFKHIPQMVPSVEDIYFAKELSFQINGEIEHLPHKMQQIFILSRKEHKTITEISNQLNLAPRTVKNQLSNALKILRSRLRLTGLK